MEHASESAPHARVWRAAHEDEGGSPDLPLDFLLGFYETMQGLKEQLDEINATKKAMFAGVRAKFGKHQAKALQIAMRDLFTDPHKRAENDAFDAIARRYVDCIETEIDARQYDA